MEHHIQPLSASFLINKIISSLLVLIVPKTNTRSCHALFSQSMRKCTLTFDYSVRELHTRETLEWQMPQVFSPPPGTQRFCLVFLLVKGGENQWSMSRDYDSISSQLRLNLI
ncbi:hypothetical protein Plhal304r1_c052g0136001 [Plasmopara halstedii]